MTPSDVQHLVVLLRAHLPAWPWEPGTGGGNVVAHRRDLRLFAVVSSKRQPAVGPEGPWTLLMAELAPGPSGRGWRERVVEEMRGLVERAERGAA